MTNEEIISEFQAFYSERAEKGVRLAQAITDVEIQGKSLIVTFDPKATDISRELFDSIAKAFGKLSEFAGSPMMFNNEQGARLRKHIDKVDAQDHTGARIDATTASELHNIGTGGM